MLGAQPLMAFVTVTDAARARAFYRDTLGLTLVEEQPFALVFDASGTMLRVSLARDLTAAPYTVLGWRVSGIAATVRQLEQAGVSLNHYGMPGQDASGIWAAPSGARVAWFNDPDGNVLSITEFPEKSTA